MRPTVEEIGAREQRLCDHPSLSVSFLKHHGLLEPGRGGSLTWSVGKGHDQVDIHAEWIPADSTLNIIDKAWDESLGVFKVLHYHNNGIHRTYIIDPKTGNRCNRLYFVDGAFSSRASLGVPFPSTLLSPWPRTRFAAQHPRTPIVWPKPHDPVLNKPPVLEPPPQAPPAPTVVYPEGSTRRALAQRRRSGGLRPEIAARLDEVVAEARLEGRPRRRRKPWPADSFMWGAYELTPRIELDDLRAAGLIQPGERRYARLWYDDVVADLEETRICVDLTDEEFPVMVLISRRWRSETEADEARQAIWFSKPEATPQRRRYWICPVSGCLVNQLAYRQKWWASPSALRLKRESQFDAAELEALKEAKTDRPSRRNSRRRCS